MKCLSVHQPWATLIVHGFTSCEVRTWQTGHRGPLAIHASRKIEEDEVALCRRPQIRQLLENVGYGSAFELPRGGVLGVVELIDCQALGQADTREREDALCECDHRTGRFIWRLARPRTLSSPLPVSATRGIFEVPDCPELAAPGPAASSGTGVEGALFMGDTAPAFPQWQVS